MVHLIYSLIIIMLKNIQVVQQKNFNFVQRFHNYFLFLISFTMVHTIIYKTKYIIITVTKNVKCKIFD